MGSKASYILANSDRLRGMVLLLTLSRGLIKLSDIQAQEGSERIAADQPVEGFMGGISCQVCMAICCSLQGGGDMVSMTS